MYISGGSDQLSCKFFLGTLRGVAMQWMATLPPRSIQTFGQLAGSFISQFAANKAKQLEVVDLFDLKQGREESLKSYLAHFNNATVRVDDPDQKFFVKAFQKGLRAGPFCDALALRKPSNMDEIRARAEKHIEVEEDQLQRMEPDRHADNRATLPRDNVVSSVAKGLKRPAPSQHTDDSKRHVRLQVQETPQSFTPLKEKRAQILHEICHTSLLDFPRDVRGRSMGPNADERCDFHRVVGHSTEECWTLWSQIERLVQNGHLECYVQRPTSGRQRGRCPDGRPKHHARQADDHDSKAKEEERPHSKPHTWHRGTITTILGGRSLATPIGRDKKVQTILSGANLTPLGNRRLGGPTISFDDRDLKNGLPTQDEPMVISVVAAKYKIERVLVDQGSSANILYWSTYQKLKLPPGHLAECAGTLYGFAGEQVPIMGTVELETIFGENSRVRRIPVLYTVVDVATSYNIILGRPGLNQLGAVVSTYHLCMKFPVGCEVGSVWANSRVTRCCYEDSLGGRPGRQEPARPAVNMLDLDLDPRGLPEHERPLPAEDIKDVHVGSLTTQVTRVGAALDLEMEARLVTFLKQNHDIFTWGMDDMPGIDPNFISHHLSGVKDAKPVAQKKRKQGEEKRRAARAETAKLLAAGFIREVRYLTWLANIVMVKKANGKWRMCTDYTDLNKACPKDSYPLPNIDQLVDGVSGFALLSFMDAYSRYNQIRMYERDEEKTAFITDDGIFCYRVMPFGLKNAGATYQCLMDEIFKEVRGTNVEVYVDDMVVKSKTADSHCESLGRVFTILRKHQLCLNPSKCSFGVQAGKFLGYMLTERGIEANPEKCEAIIKMRSPQNVRKVQHLMGRITALSRVISRLAETAVPIFTTLKKGGHFTWTSECEEAFLRFKGMMASPPILTQPSPGTPLYLYISVSNDAFSAVLVQEKEGEQQPIYFISKVLQGPEKRYQKIEKAALALVVASRKLRPYFQGHDIVVRTDLPIRQVLRKPDLAGRMVAWSVQLSEFSISFERRGPIKAQVLADFITELAPTDHHPTVEGDWYLSVDESSNDTRSGAGIVLEGPGGILIEQSLHFDFKARTNQVEYEALLAGMRLAQELEAKRLVVKSDSKLVTGQVNGEYQARDPQLTKYREQAAAMAFAFEKFTLIHVPRDQNERVDLLAKLASTQRRGQHKSVIRESLTNPTVNRQEVGTVEKGNTWMTPFIKYLVEDHLPEDAQQARRIMKEAPRYVMVGQSLYRRGFLFPLLKCVDAGATKYVIREVHEGICGTHVGSRALASKIARAGYYWPTLKRDCVEYVRKCDKCQRFAEAPKAPAERLHSFVSPWPFNKWGVDILGPFLVAPGQLKFLVVAVDYFTKWVEVEPVGTITAERVKRFLWRKIVCCFGLSAEILFTSVEHPQSNGQAEAANKVILRGLRKRLEEAKGRWAEELPQVLWSYHTTPHFTTNETPFRLTFGIEAMIPVEIGVPSPRTALHRPAENKEELRANLDMLQEVREIAQIREYAAKTRVASRYDRRVIPRKYHPQDLVLRKVTRSSNSNKLTPNWEGPFRVTEEVGRGAYRTWNAAMLRMYFS
ncbi:Retrovirus-related Pol polyprotein from transposon 17.6, partial [Mucuna pruriens]